MTTGSQPDLGARIFHYVDTLAGVSEQPQQLTRRSLTPEHGRAMAPVTGWMEAAGMTVRTDPMGNVIGRYEGTRPGLPTLALGSHLDTVPNAGRRRGGMVGTAPRFRIAAQQVPLS